MKRELFNKGIYKGIYSLAEEVGILRDIEKIKCNSHETEYSKKTLRKPDSILDATWYLLKVNPSRENAEKLWKEGEKILKEEGLEKGSYRSMNYIIYEIQSKTIEEEVRFFEARDLIFDYKKNSQQEEMGLTLITAVRGEGKITYNEKVPLINLMIHPITNSQFVYHTNITKCLYPNEERWKIEIWDREKGSKEVTFDNSKENK